MIQARDEGLIGGVGLSNIPREHLLLALARTPVVCVQNPLNLVNRASMPILEECHLRGIAFVPFFPLGSGLAQTNPVLSNACVLSTAERLGIPLHRWHLPGHWGLHPMSLVIPGTSSVRHLEQNLAVVDIELDEHAQQQLAAIAG
jgi:pyridoxine 4-dehydrogenase